MDTNVVIDYLGNKLPLPGTSFIDNLPSVISVITRIEILGKHKIKLPDAIIAATAIAKGLMLITRNSEDFKNIENLALLNPWEL